MLTNLQLRHNETTYHFDPSVPIDISLPLQPGPDSVHCFWAEPVQMDVIRVGDFVGSVTDGGSCNYLRLHITPHGNGTHTECYGHISDDPFATINRCLNQFLFFARLVTVHVTEKENGDRVILASELEQELLKDELPEALIIRTLPNSEEKRTCNYSGTNPPYLEPGIGELLVKYNIQHLLVDLPSVDRELDDGKLTNHHQFWQYPHNTRQNATITELIYVPILVRDGCYLLNLQIASLEMDASPSKPVLYELMSD